MSNLFAIILVNGAADIINLYGMKANIQTINMRKCNELARSSSGLHENEHLTSLVQTE